MKKQGTAHKPIRNKKLYDWFQLMLSTENDVVDGIGGCCKLAHFSGFSVLLPPFQIIRRFGFLDTYFFNMHLNIHYG